VCVRSARHPARAVCARRVEVGAGGNGRATCLRLCVVAIFVRLCFPLSVHHDHRLAAPALVCAGVLAELFQRPGDTSPLVTYHPLHTERSTRTKGRTADVCAAGVWCGVRARVCLCAVRARVATCRGGPPGLRPPAGTGHLWPRSPACRRGARRVHSRRSDPGLRAEGGSRTHLAEASALGGPMKDRLYRDGLLRW
jgi:hypothetical protein